MKKVLEFYGEANNALLAPRGVSMCNNVLVVSDTGQNRVFIWKKFSFQNQQQPDVVLGQKENNETERNAGAAVSSSSLQYPSAVWTNGEKVIVADAWNHRVLIWHSLPTQNFQPADTVVGQMNYESNLPNVTGIGKQPTAHTLNWPYGVFSNGKELWIADTGNRRVLYYHIIPTTNFAGADEVIGQDTFSDKDYDNYNAVWPYAVKIGSNNEMIIADTQYYRALLWSNWKNALTKKAEIIIGQKNISDNGQNQYQLKPSANTLNWVYDCCFYNNGIAIADTGNSRIVLHNQFPKQNNVVADEQIGQPNFETHGETSLSMKSNITNEMYWPFAVNYCTEFLLIADTGNHRILFYTNNE